ncbi:MAG TPA: TIGR03087 family PEP-CTERM/XrtA system glycosyltransferase [Burkholderiaceae bacterium]|nr:TIGR03087 family PEP-CTERM/XrtA system glycosyltransferase [Burkholderiaceae bacterium]
MGNLLYLVHRLPYPPNKGDKVRSYHLLKHLGARHRVFLGTFVDDPEDEVHVDTVRGLCTDLHVTRLHPRAAKVRSLGALLGGRPLTLDYYRSPALQAWVREILAKHRIDAVVVFSSAMAQFAHEVTDIPVLVDFVDVDSAKWTQYAPNHRWPLSWLYRREGERLLAYERSVAAKAQRSFFVTENESTLFRNAAPECAAKVEAIGNGVDSDFFSPDPARASPFGANEVPVVFTGAMDYWPNIDAVMWFANDIFPALKKSQPALRFYIVGRSPPANVLALANASVVVTGTVPDVRPYLQYAAVVVAPLRVARGIQNKILEAMAMARPVVASQSCVEAIDAQQGTELIAAQEESDFAREVNALLGDPARADAIGTAGRHRVVQAYSWAAHLSVIDRHIGAGARGVYPQPAGEAITAP